jgi:uncharacterized repeat protein (TIGR01451 family)
LSRLARVALGCLLAVSAFGAPDARAQSSDWTLSLRSGDTFYIDTPKDLFGMYTAVALVNGSTSDWQNVTATISLDAGNVGLAQREDGTVEIGHVAAGQTVMAYFYLTATLETTVPQSFTVTVDYEDEFGAAQPAASDDFAFVAVEETIAANANKVETVVSMPDIPTAGAPLVVTVTGHTGELGLSRVLSFTPAAYAGWPADALQLVATEIAFSGGNNETWYDWLVGTLFDSSNSDYTATYVFRIDQGFAEPTPVSPIGYIASGTQIKHTDTGGFGSLPPIEPPVVPDHIDLELGVVPDNLNPDEGSTVTYTITVTNEPIPGRDPFTATGVEVFAFVPPGTPVYPDAYLGGVPNGQASQGTFDFGIGTWNVGTLAMGESATLELILYVPYPNELETYAGTSQLFWAEVSAANEPDVDSTPGNYPIHEDDDGEVNLAPSSSGGEGGIESNGTMAGQLAQLLFDRRRAAGSTDAQVLKATPYSAAIVAGKTTPGTESAPFARLATEILRGVIPVGGPASSTAYETSPRDLLPITNADDIVAVDFVRDADGRRIGAFFGALTTGELYEHTKVICDRLRGGVLEVVGRTTVAGRPFLISRIDHEDGTVDYAISMVAVRAGSGFVLDSRFRLDEYDAPAAGDEVMNLQVWSQNEAWTVQLAEEVIHRLQQAGPVRFRNEAYAAPAVPEVYVRTGRYDRGTLELELFNGAGVDHVRLTGGSYSLSERGERIEFEREVLLPAADENGVVRVNLPLGPVFDATFFVEAPDGGRDQMYLADGAWSYTFDGTGARVGDFDVAPASEAARKEGFLGVERAAILAGDVKTWAVMYRYLRANGQPVDLSDYGYVTFTASGTGQVRVLFEKASVHTSDHFGTTIKLTEEPRTYRLWYDDLRRADGTGRLTAEDLVLVSFYVYGDQGRERPFELKVADLQFGGGPGDPLAEVPDQYELKQNYPNPFNPQTQITFGVPTSGDVRLAVYDVLGRQVATLVDGFKPEGRHTVTFDASRLASGMYLYRLDAGTHRVTRMMTLLR